MAEEMTRAERVVNAIMTDESGRDVAILANRLAFMLRDEQDRAGPITRLIQAKEVQLAECLVKHILNDEVLRNRDDYTSLLTAVQFSAADSAAVNLIVLRYTEPLIPVAMEAYEADPNGYTGPEIFSMWGAIVSELGRGTCEKYMKNVPDKVFPVANTETVGSIVVCLLLANLIGHREDKVEMFNQMIPKIKKALDAAFTGQMFLERQWGPTKPCQALGIVSTSDANKKSIRELGLLPMLEDVLRRDQHDWPVSGFDASYYMQAKASAAKCLWNMGFAYDLNVLLPTLRETLSLVLQKPDLTEEARTNVSGCLFKLQQVVQQPAPVEQKELEAKREKASKLKSRKKAKKAAKSHSHSTADEDEDDASAAGHVMLSYNWDSQTFMLWLKQFLVDHGFRVWIDVDNMNASTLEAMALAVENAACVIACVTPEYKESEACRTEGEYAYALRKPILPVKTDGSYRPDGWLGAMLGSKLWVAFSDVSEYERKGQDLLRQLHQQGIKPAVEQQQASQQGKAADMDEVTAARERARVAEAKALDLEKRLREARMQASSVTGSSDTDDGTDVASKLELIMQTLTSLADNVGDLRMAFNNLERKVDALSKGKK